jgi:hypothetical protein
VGDLSERIRRLEVSEGLHRPEEWPDPSVLPNALPWNEAEPLPWNTETGVESASGNTPTGRTPYPGTGKPDTFSRADVESVSVRVGGVVIDRRCGVSAGSQELWFG